MNTAEELSPFISAVKPPDNVVPFRKPEPQTELAYNELIYSFHMGTPYMAWFMPDLSNPNNQNLHWICINCGAKPRESAALITPLTVMCQSCHHSLNRTFTYTNKY